ncbi:MULTISPECIES: type II toxin-antitoxin system RelE/ParE family toxin [unclassified Methylobacterium]|uniref:type II toxin-antitoxin system RelE/ParE family toxin n=1 Tax=unclassified Methylobacterium TaxID=2615210 RepID=UPI001352A921|nr:type II toxin-antitoxin system RelE/ParE family toxin [Methylobacterium sp. 2A]
MTIRTTRRADLDLVEIYMAGVAKFGSEHAERYLAGLRALFSLFEERPQIARLRDEFVRPVRLYPYRAHIVAYIEHEDGILIVRVLHGRQDWTRHLA